MPIPKSEKWNCLCAAEGVSYICQFGDWNDTDKVAHVFVCIQYTCRHPQLGDIDGIHTGMETISITELTLNLKHLIGKLFY